MASGIVFRILPKAVTAAFDLFPKIPQKIVEICENSSNFHLKSVNSQNLMPFQKTIYRIICGFLIYLSFYFCPMFSLSFFFNSFLSIYLICSSSFLFFLFSFFVFLYLCFLYLFLLFFVLYFFYFFIFYMYLYLYLSLSFYFTFNFLCLYVYFCFIFLYLYLNSFSLFMFVFIISFFYFFFIFVYCS